MADGGALSAFGKDSAVGSERERTVASRAAQFGLVVVLAAVVGGCGGEGSQEAGPTPTPSRSSSAPAPTPTETSEPTETQSPTPEATVSPETQAQLDAMDAMLAPEFEALPVEDRLLWLSSVMAGVDLEAFMDRWVEWSYNTSEVYPGEPSAEDTVDEAMLHSQRIPLLMAFLKDSGVWDETGGAKDPNRAEKILIANDAAIYREGTDKLVDLYEGDVFHELLQVAGSGMFPEAQIASSDKGTDAEGRSCYFNVFDTTGGVNSTSDLCLYEYTDYLGQPASAWVQTSYSR